MRIAILLAAATTACFAAAGPVLACRCSPPPTPLEELASSDAVFSGTVTAFELDNSGLASVYRVKFDVSQCWKGGLGTMVEIQTPSHSCGWLFTAGVEYLVYATGSSGWLGTHLCDRTRRLASAQEDLDALGEPQCTTTVEPGTWSRVKRIFE